ncbi:AlkA N-terminal domain-containing protein [Oscillatoria laete-virens NRMC-F 0139]|nr:AlkA N-terminal domain-containing protein [Oscillatoria laete-virens]MDL5052001.1 AlkA N-terminal domain-containing protein [Oscillatoria laete-virens NRMC-F 0139]
MLDTRSAYKALASRDPRFDGVFFVGVTSTGVYCRPICPVKTPLQKNCRFFRSAEAAEKEYFRPCLRCRPELAPGLAPVDNAQRIASLVLHRMDEGLVNGAGMEDLAAQFHLSSRQLRRIVQKELGVSPVELLQTRRLLLAKQLLTETQLPVTQIAFASGFASLRRFNAAFSSQYRMPPTRLRKSISADVNEASLHGTSRLQLGYRPPLDWRAMLQFLAGRAIRNVEWATNESYARTVRIGKHTGWIRVTQARNRNTLVVEFTHSLTEVLPALLGRLRNLFDLAARPDQIASHLSQDPVLKKCVLKNPGLRVPGAFDGFEMALRAILGQQITVQAATTLAGRVAECFGEKIRTPFEQLTYLSPRVERIAGARTEDIAELGIIAARSNCMIALARAVRSGALKFETGSDPALAIQQLIELPGIGPWTAHYIAMRALRWPDAFPKEDIAVRKKLGGLSSKQAEARSQLWRPWRSYAVLHLWTGL